LVGFKGENDYLFKKYFLSTYYVPGIVLGIGDTGLNKTTQTPAFMKLTLRKESSFVDGDENPKENSGEHNSSAYKISFPHLFSLIQEKFSGKFSVLI